MIDLNSRSDKILLDLGMRLSEASANVHQAVDAWHRLVVLEKQLKKEIEEKPSPDINQAVTDDIIRMVKSDCDSVACELKSYYNEIKNKLFPVPEELNVVIARLDKDYSETFKIHGL